MPLTHSLQKLPPHPMPSAPQYSVADILMDGCHATVCDFWRTTTQMTFAMTAEHAYRPNASFCPRSPLPQVPVSVSLPRPPHLLPWRRLGFTHELLPGIIQPLSPASHFYFSVQIKHVAWVAVCWHPITGASCLPQLVSIALKNPEGCPLPFE